MLLACVLQSQRYSSNEAALSYSLVSEGGAFEEIVRGKSTERKGGERGREEGTDASALVRGERRRSRLSLARPRRHLLWVLRPLVCGIPTTPASISFSFKNRETKQSAPRLDASPFLAPLPPLRWLFLLPRHPFSPFRSLPLNSAASTPRPSLTDEPLLSSPAAVTTCPPPGVKPPPLPSHSKAGFRSGHGPAAG